jgi:hypothetical protein
VEEANRRHRRLLRARRERPGGRGATDNGDEVPPPHGAHPKAKHHEVIIAPCIAAKSGHSSPLKLQMQREPTGGLFRLKNRT